MGIIITIGDDNNFFEFPAWVAESPYAEQNIKNYIEILVSTLDETDYDINSFYADWRPTTKQEFLDFLTEENISIEDVERITD